jgi:hypothetical protein
MMAAVARSTTVVILFCRLLFIDMHAVPRNSVHSEGEWTPPVRLSVSNPPPNQPSRSAITTKGNKGKTKSAKPSVKNRISSLPPMDLQAAERKMEELQRYAHSQSSLSFDSQSISDSVSDAASLSTTEAMFLARQRDPSPSLKKRSVLPLPLSSANQPQGHHDKDRDNRQSSLIQTDRDEGVGTALEVVVEALRSRLQIKESELEKKDLRVRQLLSELEKLRSSHQRELDMVNTQVCRVCHMNERVSK